MENNPRHFRASHVLIIAIVLCFVAVVLGVCLGAIKVSPLDFLQDWMSGNKTSTAYRIVMYTRIPRVFGALLAGCSLAVAGAILQAVLQNPLASPNVIGINSGAGLFVLVCSSFFPAQFGWISFAAFLGALFTAMFVYVLSAGINSSKATLILTGIAVTSVLGAGMNLILIIDPDAYVGASNFLVGGFQTITMKQLGFPVFYIIAGLILAMFLRQDLNVIGLGDSKAQSLGMNVPLVRFVMIMTAALLAGAAVSFAGLIGFIGLIVPHAIRFLIGNDNKWVIPICAFGGAAFTVLCDLFARTAFAPYEIPAGIILALLGGPFFIFLVLKNRKKVRND
jgi:iron complex transport system permease protein